MKQNSHGIVTLGARSGILLGLVTETNLKLAGKSERLHRSLRAHRAWWTRIWRSLLAAIDGQECFMRHPGERIPSPGQQPGPRWNPRSDDWDLAA